MVSRHPGQLRLKPTRALVLAGRLAGRPLDELPEPIRVHGTECAVPASRRVASSRTEVLVRAESHHRRSRVGELHAAVSLWLNAGVPAAQVAEWTGHGVHVLLKVYAKCIDGQDEAARRRIEAALNLDVSSGDPGE